MINVRYTSDSYSVGLSNKFIFEQSCHIKWFEGGSGGLMPHSMI